VPTLVFFMGLFHHRRGLVHTGVIEALWWAFTVGAGLGGNGTAVAASANVVGLGSPPAPDPTTFWQFNRYVIPVTLLSTFMAWI
jgi:Na+/H+ antiporter NhaD/arsenite permease-like protein